MQKREYESIQFMRGIAAMMVVCYHIMVRLGENWGMPEDNVYSNLSSGVDIFFVISGFVMAVSSQSLAQRVDGYKVFIVRRLIRIVPLYWLLTSLKLVLVLLAGHGTITLMNALGSYLFVPARDATGEIRTVLPPGWTLSFEMLFYVCFAASLALKIRPLRFLTPLFAAVAVVSLFRRDEWPAVSLFFSMFPLEFLLGVAIGNLALQERKMDARLAVVVFLIGSVAILTLPLGPIIGAAQGVGRISLRVLTWGVPAGAVIAAIVSLEDRLYFPRWLLTLGAASYSIYLTHGFFLAAMPFLLKHGLPALPVAAAMAVVCAGGGVIVYQTVELRLLAALKRPSPAKPGRLDRVSASDSA